MRCHRIGPPLAQSPTWLKPAAARSRTRPGSLLSSLHYLPVRRVNCQLGRPAVWQKRHASIPAVPTGSVCACRAWGLVRTNRTARYRPALKSVWLHPRSFLSGGAEAPEPLRPRLDLRVSRRLVAVSQTRPSAARSARIRARRRRESTFLHTRHNSKYLRRSHHPGRFSRFSVRARLPFILRHEGTCRNSRQSF
jgi:hypothetical protein